MSRCGVDDEESLMWGAWDFAFKHAFDFAELRHKVGFVMETACCIDDHKIDFVGFGVFRAIIANGCWVTIL